jgi:hypothetical protein
MTLRSAFSFVVLTAAAASACHGSNGTKTPPPHPVSCGGSASAQGMVGSVAFVADDVSVVGVNGNALTIFLTDSVHGNSILWFSIVRSPTTKMFAPGSYQAEAVFTPNLVGLVNVELTAVVDPFDTAGQPLPGPDGGAAGSVAGSFVANFGNDIIYGDFSSPVCSVTDNV